jgi:Spx/MgsR family transcriptional regulator
MTIYGIKTCSTVGKAVKFMKAHEIAFDFVDYKKESVGEEKIKTWLKKVEIDLLFNNRGKKYRDLKLKELNLDTEGKITWMAKENYLLKRPVIEFGEGEVLLGFGEERYQNTFL